MAQTGFIFTDEARIVTAVNASATTAIEAGDIVWCPVNDDRLGGTAAAARNAYSAANAIKVKSKVVSATGFQTVAGVAMQDMGPGAFGPVAEEGVFIHAVRNDTEAGDAVRANNETDNKLTKLNLHGATTTITSAVIVSAIQNKIGRALSGGSADGKYILWKLTV